MVDIQKLYPWLLSAIALIAVVGSVVFLSSDLGRGALIGGKGEEKGKGKGGVQVISLTPVRLSPINSNNGSSTVPVVNQLKPIPLPKK